MSESQKKCAYCHAILFEDDDVVYCPECGAPHHRECYQKLGECANKSAHGLRAEQTEQAEQPERPDGVPLDREGHICKRCGKRSTSDTLFCPYCATPFVEADRTSFGNQPTFVYNRGFGDPYGGVDPNEELEGVSVREYASFVRSNTQRYIPLFKRMSEGKSIGWNWAAFFFGPSWLFFRKCYREGFIALLFRLIPALLSAPINISISTFIYENGVTEQELRSSTEVIMRLAETIPPVAWIMMIIGLLVTLAIGIVLAMYGDRLYMTRVKKRIAELKADDRFEDKTSAIAMSGGCNIFSAVILNYLFNIVSNLIITLLM